MRQIFLYFISIFLIILNQTAISAQDWQRNRLLPLEKITVGPWDNFDPVIDQQDTRVFYTRDQNQILKIMTHDLQGNQSEILIDESGDSKDPALSSDGTRLAFTYYGSDAQGDICIFHLAQKQRECITDDKGVEHSPFWIDEKRLGYLSRQVASNRQDLMEFDFVSKTKSVLHSGWLAAPVASPNGQLILFIETDNKSVVKVLHRNTGQIDIAPAFDLSGLTGYLSFSSDGKYVYFNHYLNDTNFDKVIDGNDHSVAFRVSLDDWLGSQSAVVPEQLTSVDTNCKFPSVTSNYLYLTCAFEGSLDVYRLPLTGRIPVNWSMEDLWEAHAASRNYEERLLILNTLRFRNQKSQINILERMLSNHLEIGEYTAASYFMQTLIQHFETIGQHALADVYQALNLITELRAEKRTVPINVITAQFQLEADRKQEALKKLSLAPNTLLLMQAVILNELNQPEQALETLKNFDLKLEKHPLLLYLLMELYQQLVPDNQAPKLLGLYEQVFNHEVVPFEGKVFYAHKYLQLLASTSASMQYREQMLNEVQKVSQDNRLARLFEVELSSLVLAQASDIKTQNTEFKKLSGVLKEYRKNLVLRNVMHIRAIQILGAANQFQFMELLSRNWLAITDIREVDFYNAAEQYSVVTMNKAYGFLADRDFEKAYATFYSAIRQTNDLEAHYQYIDLGNREGLDKKTHLQQSYAMLQKENILGDQKLYVDALQNVMEYERDPRKNGERLSAAEKLLLQLPNTGATTAMRELLLAYIYHVQLRANKQGFRFDKRLYQKAHYHYMMSLDFGRENSRVTATVLNNLGWLHFDVRNYGLSSEFFQRRLGFPFVVAKNELATRWVLARAEFYNYQNEAALSQSKIVLALAKDLSKDTAPYLEKVAFYATQAGAYHDAVQAYESLEELKSGMDPVNMAKALLAKSYALMKLGRTAEAIAGFQAMIAACEALPVLAQDDRRLVSFQPKRLMLLAYGFLAQISPTASEQATFRLERIALLKSIQKQVEEFSFSEAVRLEKITKDYQQAAVIMEREDQVERAAEYLRQSLSTGNQWSQETGDNLGPVLYLTMINTLIMASSNDKVGKILSVGELQKTYEQMKRAFEAIPYRTNFDRIQQAKLDLFWQAFQLKKGLFSRSTYQQQADAILNSEAVLKIKAENASDYERLKIIANAF